MREEFEEWKKSLDLIATQQGEDFNIDVMKDNTISSKTLKLKKNTRFGNTPDDSTNFEKSIKDIIKKINSNKINFQIEGTLVKSLYTHVPSIMIVINKIFQSMASHSPEHGATTIKIESKKYNETVEIIIWDDSTKLSIDSLENRNFVHGKLTDAIRYTNGLCDYFVETTTSDGNRDCIDMHNESHVKAIKDNGFVHRLIFPYLP